MKTKICFESQVKHFLYSPSKSVSMFVNPPHPFPTENYGFGAQDLFMFAMNTFKKKSEVYLET